MTDNQRTLVAVALSIAVLLVWTWYFTPKHAPSHDGTPGAVASGPAAASPTASGPESSTPAGAGPAAAAAAPAAPLAGLGGTAAPAAKPALPDGTPVAAGSLEEIVIDTPLASIRLTNRGARVTSWKLKKYLDETGKPLDLVSPAAAELDHLPLEFLLDDPAATEALKHALFRVTRAERNEAGRHVTEIAFTWSDGRGLAATKALRVADDAYLAEIDFAAQVGGAPAAPAIVWGAGFGEHTGLEEGQFADALRALVRTGETVEPRPSATIKAGAPWTTSGPITWAGIDDTYFAALLVPPEPAEARVRFTVLRLVREGREALHLTFACALPGLSHAHLFVGPKDYQLLKQLGMGLDGLLDFGTFWFIAKPLFYAMTFIDRYVGNFGWAIVILTVAIRLLFFPFMHRSQVKMRRMQEKMKRVQPKVKALRERYRRKEREALQKGQAAARHEMRGKMNAEMMELYKEEDINPFGTMSGCLPLLLQIPILYGFYRVLSIAIELRHAPFMLWIRDLSQPDPYYVTPIVMGGTMLIQQVMTSASMPDPMQRRIMYIMPIAFTAFFVKFPSGLVLYWLVNNLLGILQQYLINKEVDAEGKAAA